MIRAVTRVYACADWVSCDEAIEMPVRVVMLPNGTVVSTYSRGHNHRYPGFEAFARNHDLDWGSVRGPAYEEIPASEQPVATMVLL